MNHPSSFFHTREQPEAAGLSATLRHVSGWQALSITGSPQTLELAIVNRTPHRVTAGPAQLRLVFRPGILTDIDHLALAPQSEAQWLLTVEQESREGHIFLIFSGVVSEEAPLVLEPGAAIVIRMDGVSAKASGGSRATRIEFDYAAFFHDDGAEISGHRLLHLPVLRRHEPMGISATESRRGSTALSGPFEAGFATGADILNDGKSANTLVIRVVNVSRHAVPLSSTGDEATRLHLSFETGGADTQWGLLGSDVDHLSVTAVPQGWQVDNHTLRRTLEGLLKPRESMDIVIEVHTKALTGQAQVILTYENLPGSDDGDLVLLANLGPVAHREGSLFVDGGLEVDGPIRSSANHVDIGSQSFEIGGDMNTFYPVVFEDKDWDKGELRLEVFRAQTQHASDTHRGSLMAKISCHGDREGQGSQFWSVEARQTGSVAGISRTWLPDNSDHRFIGGFVNDPYRPFHILWLAGAASYSWQANHRADILYLNDLLQPGDVQLMQEDHPGRPIYETMPRQGMDKRFDAPYVSVTESLGVDTNPVPSGSIIMWSGSVDDIPMGWLLCDGANGTPDLRGRFVVGQGQGTYKNTDDPGNGETYDFPGQQTGGKLRVSLSEGELPEHNHSGWSNDAGEFSFSLDLQKSKFKNETMHGGIGSGFKISVHDSSSTSKFSLSREAHQHYTVTSSVGNNHAHENLPPYFALCFIMKK